MPLTRVVIWIGTLALGMILGSATSAAAAPEDVTATIASECPNIPAIRPHAARVSVIVTNNGPNAESYAVTASDFGGGTGTINAGETKTFSGTFPAKDGVTVRVTSGAFVVLDAVVTNPCAGAPAPSVKPTGGPDTGDGSTTGGAAPMLAVALVLTIGVVGAAVRIRRQRRSRR